MTATEKQADVIDGKAFAAALREKVGEAARAFEEKAGRKAGLAVVLVGDDAASQVYVASKGKATIAAGMASFEHKLPGETSQDALETLVRQLNADPTVDGILVQLPLPGHLDDKAVIALIDPDKDVDGLTDTNIARLANQQDGLFPCTPFGCMILLEDRLGDLSGKTAVVVGRSQLVGRPMAQLLVNANATVTIAHSRTKDLPAVVRGADIVIAAVGRPEIVRGDWIAPGATVIDVGINRLEPEPGAAKGKLVGDVAFAEVRAVAGAVTPVPGGVGPMTIAVLLRNAVVAAYRNAGLPPAPNLP